MMNWLCKKGPLTLFCIIDWGHIQRSSLVAQRRENLSAGISIDYILNRPHKANDLL